MSVKDAGGRERYSLVTFNNQTSCAHGDTLCPRPSPLPVDAQAPARRRADAT